MTDISVSSVAYQVEKRSWLLSQHGTDPGTTPSITLDVSAFTAGVHYPNGYIPSGTNLAKITASGLYGPYTVSNEVQTLTEGGSGSPRSRSRSAARPRRRSPPQRPPRRSSPRSRRSAPSAPATSSSPAAGGPYTVTFQGALAGTTSPR
jgi:hypothetical protein